MPAQPVSDDPNPLEFLREDFRRQLDLFYSRLKLAPPYDSVEKALRQLASAVKALPTTDQRRLVSEPAFRWAVYRRAFIESGLKQKHRGIITRLAKQRGALDLPKELEQFLDLYLVRG